VSRKSRENEIEGSHILREKSEEKEKRGERRERMRAGREERE
jgi:hypothetical protein